MRAPTRSRRRRWWAVVVLCPVLASCAGLPRTVLRPVPLAPNGLSSLDDGLRRTLATGGFASALERTAPGGAFAPGDALLAALYRGTAAFYAGEYAAAAHAFAVADQLGEARETRSVSRGALALVTNDRVLPYVPSRTERLFVRYYAMLAGMHAGDLDRAVVEARRLGHLLQRDADALSPRERATHAVLRDAAGAVFEAAGEWNDASVSYRNAALLRGASAAVIDEIVATPPPPDSQRVVMLVERGFAPYRVDQGLAVAPQGFARRAAAPSVPPNAPVFEPPFAEPATDALERPPALSPSPATSPATSPPAAPSSTTAESPIARIFRGGRRPGRRGTSPPPGVGDATALTAAVLDALGALPEGGLFAPGEVAFDGVWHDRRPWRVGPGGAVGFLRVSWPVLLRTPAVSGALRLRSDSVLLDADVTPSARADIAQALAADLSRAWPGIAARLIARAVARGAIVDAVSDRHGEVAGLVTALAGAALERADTRTWHLLPGELEVIRTMAPRGAAVPSLWLGDPDTGPAQRVEVAGAHAVSGSSAPVRILSARVWRDAHLAVTADGLSGPRNP